MACWLQQRPAAIAWPGCFILRVAMQHGCFRFEASVPPTPTSLSRSLALSLSLSWTVFVHTHTIVPVVLTLPFMWRGSAAQAIPGGYYIGEVVYSLLSHSGNKGGFEPGSKGRVDGPAVNDRDTTLSAEFEGYCGSITMRLTSISRDHPNNVRRPLARGCHYGPRYHGPQPPPCAADLLDGALASAACAFTACRTLLGWPPFLHNRPPHPPTHTNKHTPSKHCPLPDLHNVPRAYAAASWRASAA